MKQNKCLYLNIVIHKLLNITSNECQYLNIVIYRLLNITSNECQCLKIVIYWLLNITWNECLYRNIVIHKLLNITSIECLYLDQYSNIVQCCCEWAISARSCACGSLSLVVTPESRPAQQGVRKPKRLSLILTYTYILQYKPLTSSLFLCVYSLYVPCRLFSYVHTHTNTHVGLGKFEHSPGPYNAYTALAGMLDVGFSRLYTTPTHVRTHMYIYST